MAFVRIQEAASFRLDEIYRYPRDGWGTDQADRYINGLFDAFAQIDSIRIASKPVPAAFGVYGFFCRYQQHFIYWRRLSNGDVSIVTVFYERMHQIDRFKEDFTYQTLTARFVDATVDGAIGHGIDSVDFW